MLKASSSPVLIRNGPRLSRRRGQDRTPLRIATGIAGFDELSQGGLPRGRLSVVSGASGCGKSVFALQTLAHAARQGERAVYVCFEQGPEEVRANLQSFDWSLPSRLSDLVRFIDGGLGPNVLAVGRFDIAGLLANVETHCREIGASWVVFDGIDALIGILADPVLERREIYRLKCWIRDMRIGCIVTSKEAGGAALLDALQLDGALAFAADFVVHLSVAIREQASARRLRVVKNRGAGNPGREFPFILDARGITLGYRAPPAQARIFRDRVSSGIRRLDALLDGGYRRGSCILVSGEPGTAKTILAASFASAATRRRERVLLVSFDEDSGRLRHNLSSVGISLGRPLRDGSLQMLSLPAGLMSPEHHYVQVMDVLRTSGAKHLVIDPVNSLSAFADPAAGPHLSVLQQLLEQTRSNGVTTLLTSVRRPNPPAGGHDGGVDVATLVDTWLMLAHEVACGERTRVLSVVKARGTNHSNQVRRLLLGPRGVDLADDCARAQRWPGRDADPGSEAGLASQAAGSTRRRGRDGSRASSAAPGRAA